jgi:uncharacterized protein YjdB
MKTIASLALLFAPALLTSCGGGASTHQQATPQVSSVAVTPQFIFLTVGSTEQLTASATLSDGSAGTPPSDCWSSSDTKIVSIDSQGMASALAPGMATITCTDAGVTGSTSINVQPTFSTSAFSSGTFLYLQNAVGTDVVRLGMDTNFGGAVSEFSPVAGGRLSH